MNLVEEGKRLLAVTSLETTNSVFSMIHENNSSSISTPGPWISEEDEEAINKLNGLLAGRFEWDNELHVYEVRKTGY